MFDFVADLYLFIYKKLSYSKESARDRRLLRRLNSFVTDFATNRKPVFDSILENNSNLHAITHRFRFSAEYWSNRF